MNVTEALDGDGICRPCRVVLGMGKRRNEQRVIAEAEAILRGGE